MNAACSPAPGLPCPGRHTSSLELPVFVSLPNQTSCLLKQRPSLFCSLGLNIRATLISIKWPTKVFGSCLIVHTNKSVIHTCHDHRFSALNIWHPFHLFCAPEHLLTSTHWVWSGGSGIRCLVLSLQNGRGNPRQSMDLEGNDPETKKWMQSNLVFSLPNNSLRSSYHLLIHVLALKLVWGCSPGAQAELCRFFTGSYLTRLHAETRTKTAGITAVCTVSTP